MCATCYDRQIRGCRENPLASEPPSPVLPASLAWPTLGRRRRRGWLCSRYRRLVPIDLDVLYVLAWHHDPPNVALILLAALLACEASDVSYRPRSNEKHHVPVSSFHVKRLYSHVSLMMMLLPPSTQMNLPINHLVAQLSSARRYVRDGTVPPVWNLDAHQVAQEGSELSDVGRIRLRHE